jgi:hypothetical protein
MLIHTSLRRKLRQVKIFRIFSTFNATVLVLEAKGHRLAWGPEHSPGEEAGAPAGRGSRGRQTDRHGTPSQ